MATIPDQRFRSGDVCPRPRLYQFAGYTDESANAPPDTESTEVALAAGDVFPPMKGRPCYWEPVDNIELEYGAEAAAPIGAE